MKKIRSSIGVMAVGALMLVGAAPASAAATTLSVNPSATLGPQGASVSVQVTVTCDEGSIINYLDVQVQQRVGRTLVAGFGNVYSGAHCTGSPQTVDVRVEAQRRDLSPFKRGKAVAHAYVGTCTPDYSSCDDTRIFDQALSIK